MKKVLILLLFLLPASLMWLSCGGGSLQQHHNQRSQDTAPSSPITSAPAAEPAGVYIVNADTDVRAPISPISAGNTPGMMVVTPNRAQTLVFSGNGTQFSDNQFTIINNATEANAAHLSFGTGRRNDGELRRFPGQLHRLCCPAQCAGGRAASPGAVEVIV